MLDQVIVHEDTVAHSFVLVVNKRLEFRTEDFFVAADMRVGFIEEVLETIIAHIIDQCIKDLVLVLAVPTRGS